MSKGYAAYKSAVQSTTTDRGREVQAFALVTSKLEKASLLVGNSDLTAVAAVQDALQHNMQLWDILRIVCAEEQNALPKEIRFNLVQIARFMQARTEAMTGTADDRPALAAMIEINRNVMAGLAPIATQAADAAPASASVSS